MYVIRLDRYIYFLPKDSRNSEFNNVTYIIQNVSIFWELYILRDSHSMAIIGFDTYKAPVLKYAQLPQILNFTTTAIWCTSIREAFLHFTAMYTVFLPLCTYVPETHVSISRFESIFRYAMFITNEWHIKWYHRGHIPLMMGSLTQFPWRDGSAAGWRCSLAEKYVEDAA